MISRPTGLHVVLMLAGVAVIFAIDTFAPLDIAIAALYAVVVIASADFLGRRGILLVCAVCVLQTLLSYAIVHFDSLQSAAWSLRLSAAFRFLSAARVAMPIAQRPIKARSTGPL